MLSSDLAGRGSGRRAERRFMVIVKEDMKVAGVSEEDGVGWWSQMIDCDCH